MTSAITYRLTLLMRKALKIGGTVILTMVILILAIFVVAVYVVDDQFYLGIVQEAVKDSTGHTLDIKGQLAVERSLRPGLVANEVRLVNEGVQPPAEIATVKHFRFRIDLLPLLQGDLRFVVVLEQPQIRLDVDGTGRRNWQSVEVKPAPTDQVVKDGGFNLDIGHVEIFDGLVAYRDARDDSSVDVKIKNFELHHDRAEGLATVGFLGSYQGEDYSVHGSMRDPAEDKPLQAELVIDGYDANGASAVQGARTVLQLTATGTVSRPEQEPAFDLAVDGRLQNLTRLAENLGLKAGEWAQLGPVSTRARLQLQHGVYHVKDIDAALEHKGLAMTATGDALRLNRDPDINLQLSVNTEDVTQLTQFKQVVPLDLLAGGGTVSAEARLVGADGRYRLEDLQAHLDQEDLQLNLRGLVTNLEQEFAAELEGSLKVAQLMSLSRFSDLVPNYLPGAGTATAEFKVTVADGIIRLYDLDTTLTTDGLTLVATGAMSELGDSNELDLELSATAETLSKLSQIPALSQAPFPDLGPAKASGRLRGSRASYRVDNLHASLTTEDLELTAAGTVSELGDQPQARLDVTARIKDLSRIPEIIGLEMSLPPVGPIEAKGVIESSKGKYQIQQLNALWEQPGVRATLTGNATSLWEAPELAMQLELQADSLDALSVLTQQELPEFGPVSLKSKLALDPHQYRMSELDVQLGSSDLSGEVSLMREETPPRLTAALSSRLLDLDELLVGTPQPEVEGEEAEDNQATTDSQTTEASDSVNPDEVEPWLPTEPLNLSWLHAWNVRVDAQLDRMVESGDFFDDVEAQVRLEDGMLHIPVTRVKLQDGQLSLTASIDARQSPPSFYYLNEAKDIDIGNVLDLSEGVVTGGKINGTVELQSSGRSPAEILSGLSGKVLLQMGSARIVEGLLAGVSGDLLGGMLRGISQGSDEQPYTEYECGVFGIDIKDGIVTMKRSLALQSERFNVGGSGQVDLNKGTIHLDMRPRARKGLGISAAMLTGGFKISGKLGAPEAGLSMKGLLESYLLGSTAALLVVTPGGAAAGAALALRGVWDRIRSGAFSCKNTLKRIERRNSRTP